MNIIKISKVGTVILSCATLLFFSSCGQKKTAEHDEHEHAAEAAGHDDDEHDEAQEVGVIELSEAQAQAAGLATETVARRDFHAVISTCGSIETASSDVSTVVASTQGVVRLLTPITTGMPVARGQALFSISAKDIQDGDPAERARIAYSAARREYERAEALVKDKLITEREYIAAKESYDMARVAYNAVAKSSRGQGVTIVARSEGYVVDCTVKDGDYVDVGSTLLTTTRNRRVNIVADVPVRHAAALRTVRSAKFRSSYGGSLYDVDSLRGRLVAYGHRSAATSSFVPITFEVDCAQGLLPGMTLEVWLVGEQKPSVITLPVAAITEEQGTKFVYIKLKAGHYSKREVSIGSSDGERVEITSGLHEGEEVVVKGAMHVKLAAASNVIPAHTHSH